MKMKIAKIPTIRLSIFSPMHCYKHTGSYNIVGLPPTEADYLLNTPTANSLPAALQHFINSENPSHGQKIHSHIIKTGYKPNINISIKLLILYIKSDCVSYARQVFDELRKPSLSAYNYLISGYIKHGFFKESYDLVRRMVSCNILPDEFTFSMILKASTCKNSLSFLGRIEKEVHSQIIKSDVLADDVLYTGLVDSYVKRGRVDYARRVFDIMLEKNVVCSTSLITGYMKKGSFEDAEDVFNKTNEKDVVVFNAMIEGLSKSVDTAKKALEVYIQMQRSDYRPTMSTFASIIGACSTLSAFEVGQQVHGQLAKAELLEDIKMGSALIDMYAKCGRTEEARKVFNHMPERNVFSWTSMIDGYGKNGEPFDALELFRRMQRDNQIRPNYVTFLSAISACGHAGLVDEGKKIFESMETEFSMKPQLEHYACMVDLLGRAGNLNQALEFIMGMPEKPNSDVWAALLSSCRLHGDTVMASITSKELFKLSADDRPGAYVALSNTLADAGRWDSVSKIRELMKVRGISKDTAFSWIGSDGGLEAFHVGQTVYASL